MRKIIFFELNEVPFSVIDYYCEKKPTSHLANLLPVCTQIETYTEDEGELSPWITWPTLHRGVSNQQHQIKDFGEDLSLRDEKFPTIWKILADNAKKPGVFASMHTFPMPKNYHDYSFFIPDPFASESQTHPASFEPFQKFNLAMSRRSGRNVDSGIDMKSASELAVNLPAMGIQTKTLVGIAGQLVSERVEAWKKNRRRIFQSVLAFDIFHKLVKSKKPSFSTFFSNHVASAMHRYWAATFPHHYQTYNLSEEWKNRFAGEIDFAMGKFDDFFGRMVKFANQNPEYKIVVTSSMGQEATKAEQLATELYGKQFEKFIAFLGAGEDEWEPKPAMHPQYNLTVNPEKLETFRKNLHAVRIDGKSLIFREKENGFFSINLGHRNLEVDYFELDGQKVPFQQVGLVNEAVDDESDGTAYHIPEGCLFIYDPLDKSIKTERRTRVNTIDIAPSLLENFGIEVPGYMSEGRIPELCN